MKFWNIPLIIAASVLSYNVNAASYQFDSNGDVNGVTGVDIAGTLWDASFQDGI